MTDEARPDPLVGRTVADGRYQVLALLGVGGMRTVYRALQHPLERQVALKLIHRELAMNEKIVARFEREMRMTASIEHPHTVRVYDFGSIDGQPFLAMEYLAGRSLRTVLDTGGALPSDRLAAIGVQIAKALRAAHRAGIVHRDLKPDNVLLVDGYGERDFVKVLDFGIARPLEQEPGFQTSAGAIVGTPAYMSPEQVNGAPVDPRSDLYALGVILFELATGAPPFAGPMTVLLMAHARQAPPSLDGFHAIPAEVRALSGRLLEKDPAARPASADEVIDALAPFAAGETTARPTAPPRTAILPGTEAARAAIASAPPTGTQLLPEQQAPRAPLPPRSAAPARASGGHAVRWLVLLGLLVIAGAGALGYRQRRAAQSQPARYPIEAQHGERPAATKRGDEANVAEDLQRMIPALQAAGEPPWPAACRSADATVLRRLAEMAPALREAQADATTRTAALAALRALPPSSAARRVIEARLTLPADPEAALKAAEKATSLCPRSPVAHNLLGNALQRTQRLDRAAQEYGEAADLAPAFLAPLFNAGLIELQRDQAPRALGRFQAVARVDPDYPNLGLVQADAHRRMGLPDAVRADLEDQVSRHPDVAEGWLLLGRARASARDRSGARDAFCHAAARGDARAASLCRGKRHKSWRCPR